MIEKKAYETPLGLKKSFFFDHKRQSEYRRIVGGLAWPSGEAPGFVLVIAEAEHKDPRLKLRHYWLLDEYEHNSAERLIKKLYDFQNKYIVGAWYSDPNNLLMTHLIDKFNGGLTKKQKGIYLTEALFSDDPHNLRLYANQIGGRTAFTKKALHFGNTSRIPGALSVLSPDDIYKKKAQEFPMVAALGFAIAGLEELYVDVVKDRELHEQYLQATYAEGL
jgi:hypothetical protein